MRIRVRKKNNTGVAYVSDVSVGYNVHILTNRGEPHVQERTYHHNKSES